MIYKLTGTRMPDSTTSRWATGKQEPPASVFAVLALVRYLSPHDLAQILSKVPASPNTTARRE